MMMRKFLSLLLIAGLPLLSHAACECEPSTHEERMESATAVFLGRLLEITTDKKTGKRSLLFDPVDVYKGEPKDDARMIDTDQDQPCEMPVKEGAYYLVFAHWQWGDWVTSRCWGTKPIEEAKEESEKLGLPNSAKDKLYKEIQKHCMGLYTTSCCLSSLKAMQKGYYLPEPDQGCAAGMKPDTLTCGGSLRWCVGINDRTTADPSGGTP